MNIIIPKKPFYKMNTNELRQFFMKTIRVIERKNKTRRKYKHKKRKTARK